MAVACARLRPPSSLLPKGRSTPSSSAAPANSMPCRRSWSRPWVAPRRGCPIGFVALAGANASGPLAQRAT
eukprot:6748533-Lingulodinium_polyedra.AAC.1